MMKVVITGTTSGIGRAFAEILLKRGCEVYIQGRTEEKCKKTIAELFKETGAKCSGFCEADVSKVEDTRKLCDFIKKVEPNMLVNNAGFGMAGEVTELDDTETMNMINVNVKALTILSATASRTMKKGDTIINVASLAAFGPNPYSAVYGATKAYVLSFSMALSKELKSQGITVTALCPGPTKTLFGEKSNMGMTKVFDGHVMKAKEVAECGLKAAEKGKLYVVAGRFNALISKMERVLPNRFILNIAASTLSFKNESHIR